MIDVISNSAASLVTICGRVVSSVFATDGAWSAIQPLIGVGIAMGVIGFAIRTIKSLSWGF